MSAPKAVESEYHVPNASDENQISRTIGDHVSVTPSMSNPIMSTRSNGSNSRGSALR